MKDDTISRQAALSALNEYFVRIGKLKRRGLNKGEKAISLDVVGTINSLPSAQPGWIPTSERLPDNDRAVLVTLKWAEDDYEVAVGEYWHNSTASHGWGSFEGHVIAWHELPTLYREGGQDGKN